MAVEEYLAFVVAVVVAGLYVAEAKEVLTYLIYLHLQIAISKWKLANIQKKNSDSCLHTRNIKFSI